MPIAARLSVTATFLAISLFPSFSAATSPAEDLDFSEVLARYKQSQASLPLVYEATGVQTFAGIEKRSFTLESQNWSPQDLVEPGVWRHDVAIYLPDDALPGQALLIANNGTHQPLAGKAAQGPTDFTEAMALSIAKQTRTIVISTSNIPNQYLTYTDDNIPRREDDSVAHSWKLFLESPAARPTLSLHIPMMQALVKTMDLAQRELAPWQVDSFIASGASKRGWATWLTALNDERVTAIVPFVIDILGMDRVLEHTYRSYGNSWPLAFSAYQNEGITGQIHTENFNKLLQIEDPLRYLDSAYAPRLTIPKYIVNASGDDFFVPDNSRFYFDKLPGQSALRIAPNSDHYGIRDYTEAALIPFINRLRQARDLPKVSIEAQGQHYSVQFSETPAKVLQWTALNPEARDFRKACGIHYQSTPLGVGSNVLVTLQPPAQGWMASFIEATFEDGMVVTTPVQILPQTYPEQRPPVVEPACKTLVDA